MVTKLSALEWGKEIENKFMLFFELFNDSFKVEVYSKVRNNIITLYINNIDYVDLDDEESIKSIRSALNMAARGCPYEYNYRIV